LSGTRPANHDSAEHAGDSPGQPLNRLFERHNVRRKTYSQLGIPGRPPPILTHGQPSWLIHQARPEAMIFYRAGAVGVVVQAGG